MTKTQAIFRSGGAVAALMALVAGLPSIAAGPAGNPTRGKTLFARCAACHSMTAGQNRIGPSLAKVVGSKAGRVAGFKYSPAMAKSGKTWTAAELDKFLKNPRTALPGSRMVFPGMTNAADRADIIAYLSRRAP